MYTYKYTLVGKVASYDRAMFKVLLCFLCCVLVFVVWIWKDLEVSGRCLALACCRIA